MWCSWLIVSLSLTTMQVGWLTMWAKAYREFEVCECPLMLTVWSYDLPGVWSFWVSFDVDSVKLWLARSLKLVSVLWCWQCEAMACREFEACRCPLMLTVWSYGLAGVWSLWVPSDVDSVKLWLARSLTLVSALWCWHCEAMACRKFEACEFPLMLTVWS